MQITNIMLMDEIRVFLFLVFVLYHFRCFVEKAKQQKRRHNSSGKTKRRAAAKISEMTKQIETFEGDKIALIKTFCEEFCINTGSLIMNQPKRWYRH